jgi:hypothetical protein
MFLTPKTATSEATGRRERSDHVSVEAAQLTFAQHPRRAEMEALIYIDGTPSWLGLSDDRGNVQWQIWKI